MYAGYYHCGQSACTLCRQQVARRKRESRSSKKHAKSYNMKLLTDLAHGKSSRAAAARSQAQSGPAISPIETSLKRNLKLYQPSEFSVIEMASSERAYTVIKKRDGGDERMHGALIPEKYDLDHTLAGYPWICSVRSCRKVFKKITSLGSHFIVSMDSLPFCLCILPLKAPLIDGDPGMVWREGTIISAPYTELQS